MKPFDAVVLLKTLKCDELTHDRFGKGVRAGTIGYIVESYNDGEAFAVEFFGADEQTIGIGTVRAEFVRPATDQDLAAPRISA